MLGEQLLIVSNPKGRRRKRKMPGRNSKGRFMKRSAARASNPKRRRRRRASNPSRSHKVRYRTRTVTKYKTRRASNPSRRHRRRRSNPGFKLGGRGMIGKLSNRLAPAIIGGAGALATDLLFQKTPIGSYIPAMFTTGYAKYATRAAGVLLVGFAMGKVKPAWKNDVIAGGLAVVAYSLLKDLANSVGGMALADYGEGNDLSYMNPASALNSYMQNYPSSAVPLPLTPAQVVASQKSGMHSYLLNDGYNSADLF